MTGGEGIKMQCARRRVASEVADKARGHLLQMLDLCRPVSLIGYMPQRARRTSIKSADLSGSSLAA